MSFNFIRIVRFEILFFFYKKPIFLVKRKQINSVAYGPVNVFGLLGLVSLQVLPFLPLPIFLVKYLVSFSTLMVTF